MKPVPQHFYNRMGRVLLYVALGVAVIHGLFLAGPSDWRRLPGMFAVLSVSLCLSLASLVSSYLVLRRTGQRVAIAARIFSNVWMVLAMIITWLVVMGK
ncbi:MAG: hypothetical protein QF662_00805 [Phycisphaerae bacterium]|nr:hypothetical protein [Phycisphaerae bacterium]